MRKRRYAFTLLEVVISLWILGMLLTFVFNLFTKTQVSKNQIRALQESVLQTSLFQNRMTQLFSQCKQGEEEGAFQLLKESNTLGPSLCFAIENAIDPQPQFCDDLHCHLYLGTDQRLYLTTWKEETMPRSEILLESVETLSFQFYHGEQKKWAGALPEKDKRVPKIFKVLLNVNKESLEFAFFPSNAAQRINYTQPKSIP